MASNELLSVKITRPKTLKPKGKPKVKRLRPKKCTVGKDASNRLAKKKVKKHKQSFVRVPLDVSQKGKKLTAWSRICYTIQLKFLMSRNGWLKLLELPIAYTFSLYLLNILITETAGHFLIGIFFPITSAVTVFTATLLISFIISPKTCYRIRRTLFEPLFNGFACFTYLSAVSFLINQQKTRFSSTQAINMNKDDFWIVKHFHYGAGIAAVVHGVDAVLGMTYCLERIICRSKSGSEQRNYNEYERNNN